MSCRGGGGIYGVNIDDTRSTMIAVSHSILALSDKSTAIGLLIGARQLGIIEDKAQARQGCW